MGITDDDKAGLDKSLKELNLSEQEVDRFTKAFKDPEFLKLFEDYAKEVSDPKVKAETDMYLRQLEMEGRLEEVYGKGAQLIMPTPSHVVKTHNTVDGSKVFINICTSDKVEKAALKPATGANGEKGMHFDMPLCLGPKKVGKDKTGNECSVWDFVVHPETIKMAQDKSSINKAMIENALEKIEACFEGVKLHSKTKVPKMTYKATEGCPEPHALTLRGKEAESVGGKVKPMGTAASKRPGPGIGGLEAAAARGTESASASPHEKGSESGSKEKQATDGSASRSNFSFPSKSKTPQLPITPGFKHPGGEVTPQWEFVHRGQVDLAETWGDAGRGMNLNTTHPKELVIRIILPGITSAAGVQLDVSCNDISVSVPQKYRLQTPLPFTVDSDKGKAKFDKVKQQLEVVVPVLPPPLPVKTSPLVTADSLCHDVIQNTVEESLPEEAAAVEALAGAEARDTEAEIVAAAEPEVAVDIHMVNRETEMTENQRKWTELHGDFALGSGSVSTAATESKSSPDLATISTKDGDSGIAAMINAGDVITVQPLNCETTPTVIQLQPRLNINLTNDLD